MMNDKTALIRNYDLFGVECGRIDQIQDIISLDEYNAQVRPILLWLWQLIVKINPAICHDADEICELNEEEVYKFEYGYQQIKIFCHIIPIAIR